MRRILLFLFTVLLPAVIVGISNFTVFPDAAWLATLMLGVTAGVAAIFTWQSAEATRKIVRYCVCADFVICAILCANLGCHWLLAREVSAAKQGTIERHVEEDRDLQRKKSETELEIARKKADEDLAAANVRLQNAERRRLAQLPPSERRSSINAAPEPTKAPLSTGLMAPMSLVPPATVGSAAIAAQVPRLTPDQVRESWWYYLTALAFLECLASVLAGAILAGAWEWDRNHDGIPDHVQNQSTGKAPRQ